MKIRTSLFAMFMFASLGGASPSGQEGTLDYFLPPSCGGSPSTPSPVRVTMETLERHRISGALPVYPKAGEKEQRGGVVALDVQVDTAGAVSQVKVLSGDPVLARAAVQAVAKWKYRPVTVGGSAIAVNGDVLLTFNPAKSPPVREGGEWPFRRLACSGPQGPLLYRIDPDYPKIARTAHVEGDVVLDVVIDREGKVAEMRVVSGHPLLVQSAMDAVKQWRYQPYLVAGQPVDVDGRVTVKFRM